MHLEYFAVNGFLSELWDGEDQILLRNVSQLKRPRFELDSLQSGRRLIIRIYSANKKGKYGPSGGTQRYFTPLTSPQGAFKKIEIVFSDSLPFLDAISISIVGHVGHSHSDSHNC